MNKRLAALLSIVFCAVSCFTSLPACSGATDYYRLVVISDLHYPYKYFEVDPQKGEKIVAAGAKAAREIQTWADVDEIVLLGDMVGETGSVSEVDKAKQFLSQFTENLTYMVGNHDYQYKDQPNSKGKLSRGNGKTQALKLAYFRKAYGVTDIYRSKRVGPYLLIYLAVDALEPDFMTQMSEQQLGWFADVLKANRKIPTIVFYHAPLDGTLGGHAKKDEDNKYAEPKKEIESILRDNPQVFMWVSGHTHTGPDHPGFSSLANNYLGRVLNIHNTDWNRQTIVTNSIYLYPDKVVVRTYNHKKAQVIMERTVQPPEL